VNNRYISPLVCVWIVLVCAPQLLAQPPLLKPASAAATADGQWPHVLQLFDEWAAVQQIYTPEQVQQWRAQLISKAATLPPADAAALATSMSAKLQVLLGAEARDARKWLAQTLEVASDSYAAKVRARLPDPRTMTAAQLQARLDEFENREANVKQVVASEQKTRQMQIQAIEDDQRAQAAANAAAWQGNNSLYGSAYYPVVPARNYDRYYPPAGRNIVFGGFFW